MTLREMVDTIGIDEEPFECAFLIAGFLRTAQQAEPSTLEGECATLNKVTELIGRVDEPETIRKWLSALGRIPDMKVPDSIWMSMAEADQDEEITNDQT